MNQFWGFLDKYAKTADQNQLAIECVLIAFTCPFALHSLVSDKKKRRHYDSHDIMKFFGILFTFTDHYAYYGGNDYWLRLLGRIAFPLLAFIIGFSGAESEIGFVLWFYTCVYTYVRYGSGILLNISMLLTYMVVKMITKVFSMSWFYKRFDSITPLNLFVLSSASLINYLSFKIFKFDYGFSAYFYAFYGWLCLRRLKDKNKTYENRKKELLIVTYVLFNWIIISIGFIKMFKLKHNICLVLMHLVLFVLMRTFKPVDLKKNFLTRLVIFLGRNSLYLFIIFETYMLQEIKQRIFFNQLISQMKKNQEINK